MYIQTWFPFPQLCMLWSWYLADDMQFYVWAIVILIFSKRYVSWINVDKSFRCHKISIAWNIRWNMNAKGLTAVLMFQNLMSMALPFVSNVYQILSVFNLHRNVWIHAISFLFIPYVIYILCRWNCKMVRSHGRTAAAIIVAFLLTSWVVSALISLKFNYTHKIAEPLESFGYLYEKPWTRLGPYVMGEFNYRNWQYLWMLFLWHRPLT